MSEDARVRLWHWWMSLMTIGAFGRGNTFLHSEMFDGRRQNLGIPWEGSWPHL